MPKGKKIVVRSPLLKHTISMRAFLLGLLLFAVLFIFGRWYFVCEIRGNCGEKEEQVTLPERPKDLYLIDGRDTVGSGPYEQFLFSPNVITPDMNPSNQAFLDNVTDYLSAHPDRKIMLIGRFSTAEKTASSGFVENIGIARAAHFESLLENRGIDQKQIETGGLLSTDAEMKRPLLFKILPKEEAQDFEIPQYRFEDNTFSDANFEFNSHVLNPSAQLKVYADSVNFFLKENPDYVLTIIGHTDSVGTAEYNLNLAQRRADETKKYFEGRGIISTINTVSMGKTQYAAPNTKPDGTPDEAGMQKNRRVNFKLTTAEQ